MMPVAWTRTFTGTSGKPSRVFATTMGAATDLESEGMRRLLVNACYWAVGREDAIPESSNVDLVGGVFSHAVWLRESHSGCDAKNSRIARVGPLIDEQAEEIAGRSGTFFGWVKLAGCGGHTSFKGPARGTGESRRRVFSDNQG